MYLMINGGSDISSNARSQSGVTGTGVVREVLRAVGVINRLAPGLARRRVQGLSRGLAVQPCSGS